VTIVTDALKLKFDGTFPVATPTNVSQWNTYFSLPTNGTPFTSVIISGNNVYLKGASSISLKTGLFAPSSMTCKSGNHQGITGLDQNTISEQLPSE